MRLKQIGSKLNIWKWGFLLLLAANLAFLAVIASRLIEVREPVTETLSKTQPKTYDVGLLTTDKEKLNRLVADYLQKMSQKDVTYSIYAGANAILFEGKYQLLGYQVPLYIYLEPYVLENGGIQLKVASLSAGTLSLPESDVLQYLKSSYDLPEFVTIKPKSSTIIVDLPQIKNNLGFRLHAKEIDLTNDKISFSLSKTKSKKAR